MPDNSGAFSADRPSDWVLLAQSSSPDTYDLCVSIAVIPTASKLCYWARPDETRKQRIDFPRLTAKVCCQAQDDSILLGLFVPWNRSAVSATDE
jgi:hypothetical protein